MRTVINQALVEKAVQGDTEAIEALLLQYAPLITKFAQKHCATPEDVEDAVQETLWVASQKIGTLRVAAAFGSWLFKIVKHHCSRLLHLYPNAESLDTLALCDPNGDPATEISLRQDVVRALAQLPLHHRQVIIMRDIEGLSAVEVAEMLGLTIPAVKSRLHHGRNSLRQMLDQWSD
ncbi:MAG: sigma-70 family RNA polymerase sigma factor [Chloroflexi bacterium]|nr:sigma-70 family RNA polymerase sigma factor [Chloroflexota bacterium]